MAAEQEAEETVSQELHSASELRIVLLGGNKTGKSEAGNTILNREEFTSASSSTRMKECEKTTGEVSERRVTVVDTPGLLDTDRVKIERCVSLSAPGPHAFLLVMQVYTKGIKHSQGWKSVVKQYCKAFDKVQELFGERAVRNTMILFTWGDVLKGRTIEQHIEEAGEELQQLVEKCGNRYHVLSNRNRSDRTQVTQLLDKIDNMVKRSGGSYTMEMYLEEKLRQKEQELKEIKQKYKEEQSRKAEELKKEHEEGLLRKEEELNQKYKEQERKAEEMKQKLEEERLGKAEEVKQRYETLSENKVENESEESKLPVRRRNSKEIIYPDRWGIMAAEQEAEETVSQELHSPSDLRIVLLGRGWAGKSSSGNTILNRKEFRSGFSFSAVMRECEKRTGEVFGRWVTVVDTPAISDTDRVEIERCVSMSAPGPHAFLLVMRVYPNVSGHAQWRKSVENDHYTAFDQMQELFGERAVRNTMILFTHGDVLKGRTIEQYIEEAGEELQQLVEKCGNRYHVLNNENRRDHTQVTQLLDKIDNMVKGSGGCYLPISSEIYQEVEERIRLKEQELNKKHKEELRRREEEMKQKYEEGHRREKDKCVIM
ncbi:UNVERIFIED_CONTAM: hypothetical protein FKN15_067347 [Acipenser sinensis]